MQTGNKINLLNLGGHSLRKIVLEFILKSGLGSPLAIPVLLSNDSMNTNYGEMQPELRGGGLFWSNSVLEPDWVLNGWPS